MRGLAGIIAMGLALVAAGTQADAGPSYLKRISKLERQMRLVTALSVSTNNQVKILERDKPLVIQPVQASIPTGPGGSANGDVQCPAGYAATGGGASFQSAHSGDHIVYSDPYVTAGEPTGWQAAAITYDQGPGTLLVEAICIRTG